MAKTFTPITSKPTKSDPYISLYNNKNNGGISWCINGKPTDSVCNVLCNCVGWACGRFNHIYDLITGNTGMKYPKFNCNAENFIEVAKNYGLEVGTEPKPGAIMVWQKGNLGSSDGAGHVAIVEKVNSSTQVVTSESGYAGFDFRNKTRNKLTGNWGASSNYKFRGFIYNPAVEYTAPASSLPSTVSRNAAQDQIYISATNVRIRNAAGMSGTAIGYASKGYYNYTDFMANGGYTWYKIGDSAWVAYNASWAKLYPASTSSSTTFSIGDSVKLNSNAVIYGKTSKFAAWVYKTTLYVRAISGDKITISVVKSGPVTGVVDKKYLTKK